MLHAPGSRDSWASVGQSGKSESKYSIMSFGVVEWNRQGGRQNSTASDHRSVGRSSLKLRGWAVPRATDWLAKAVDQRRRRLAPAPRTSRVNLFLIVSSRRPANDLCGLTRQMCRQDGTMDGAITSVQCPREDRPYHHRPAQTKAR